MSTRSTIGIKTGPDTAQVIYAHSDGYPSHMGRELALHYDTEDKVKALVAKGDVSSVVGGVARHYHEWRGEEREPWDMVKPRDVSLADAKLRGTYYLYLFVDGEWICNGTPLAQAIAEDETEE